MNNNEELNTKYQKIDMTIIANAGEARGLAFQALRAARDDRDFAKADELMKQANEYSETAHKAQTALLVENANGLQIPIDILLIHGQDHLMTAMLAIELIDELIQGYKREAQK
ncbi:MAG: PTS lactose/cellobiose transporter subunit IIA [Prevotella sp.]|jgi:PTS system cellobiose-specific IIA component|nr:PTS lactose/cellobiose transporter subunit IIA [Prevotella sp.]MCH4183831.1 PTS lactose/cellobiose transporter subunit IIA [Prevotella sp.]